MVQNNKVLTVSYGTFSCTLEGFDDSFETMKAIAEYFRDLAADDRYFGSEPPQPDAEMLTRIAQRDIARKVEASQNDTGLLLRATEETPSVSAAATPAMTTQPIAAQPSAPSHQSEDSEPATAPSAAEEAAPADSIAAKLQRIRAVVSHNEDSPPPYSEDEEDGAGYLAAAKPKVDAISAAFEAGALNPADLEEPVEEEADQIEVSDDLQAEIPTEFVEPEQDAQPEVEAELEAEVETEFEEVAEGMLEPLVLGEADVSHDDMSETFVDEQADEAANDILFADIDQESEAEVDEDEIANVLNDEDAEPEADTIEPSASVLNADDEALLLDEIAMVEAELIANAAPVEAESPAADEDVSRLMDSAGERMDDPENMDQRETYSHLRAAVAAKEAERENGEDAQADAADKDYRGDLESVVSPRRPEVQVTTHRPKAMETAPLKLVAEQRIDAKEGETAPVTPRRVKQEDSADEEGGFAHFAEEQGAQSLSDLLEAAAAYLSFIEGQEQFSRPQLMNKVRSLKQDDFNREESLRSFGQLLRDGKIEKAGGGRFAASNDIGFRPADKRAAG